MAEQPHQHTEYPPYLRPRQPASEVYIISDMRRLASSHKSPHQQLHHDPASLYNISARHPADHAPIALRLSLQHPQQASSKPTKQRNLPGPKSHDTQHRARSRRPHKSHCSRHLQTSQPSPSGRSCGRRAALRNLSAISRTELRSCSAMSKVSMNRQTPHNPQDLFPTSDKAYLPPSISILRLQIHHPPSSRRNRDH